MAEVIRWSQIEAECGGYRAGFVATFRKYEGKPTDEKDGQGRTVKVTVKSFARHAGIGETTFKGWTDQERGRRAPERDRTMEDVRRADEERQEAIVREIAKVNPAAVRTVYAEQTPQHTPVERKVAEAVASEIVAPIKEAAATLHASEADQIADLLNEVADDLSEIEAKIGKRTLNRLNKAYKRVGEEIEVLAYRSELSEEVER